MDYSTWSVPVAGGHLGGLDNGGDGGDVLFVYTAGLSALTWDPVMSRLTDLHCVALDLRGHALSAQAPLLDAGSNWRDVLRVIADRGLRCPVVVGTNTGAMMALAAAADSPHLIRSVVALECGLHDSSRAQVHAELQLAQSDDFLDDVCRRFGLGEVVGSRQDIEGAATEQAARSRTDWLLRDVGEGIADETRYSFVPRPDGTWLHTPDREAVRAAYTIDVDAAYFPTADLYDLIEVPLHVVQAEDGLNLLSPEEATALSRRPGVTVHTIGGSHLAHRSHPDEFAEVVRRAAAEPNGPRTATRRRPSDLHTGPR